MLWTQRYVKFLIYETFNVIISLRLSNLFVSNYWCLVNFTQNFVKYRVLCLCKNFHIRRLTAENRTALFDDLPCATFTGHQYLVKDFHSSRFMYGGSSCEAISIFTDLEQYRDVGQKTKVGGKRCAFPLPGGYVFLIILLLLHLLSLSLLPSLRVRRRRVSGGRWPS